MYSPNTAPETPSEAALDPPGAGAPQAAHGDERLVIQSRFGVLAISPHNAINFSNGMLGFADCHNFALAELGDARFPQFKVLQCLDDHDLAFLVLPIDPECGLIDAQDLGAARTILEIDAGDFIVLLVATVRKDAEGPRISANLRAPLLIDAGNHTGVQYILPSERYPVRYPL